MLRKSLLLLMIVSGSTYPLFAEKILNLLRLRLLTLKPTHAQKEAGNYISQYLLQNHYRKVSVNDSLSQQIFNRYIDNLDGSKSYFLASDDAPPELCDDVAQAERDCVDLIERWHGQDPPGLCGDGAIRTTGARHGS